MVVIKEPALMKLKVRVLMRLQRKITDEPGMFTFINVRCPIRSSVSYRAQIGRVSAPLKSKKVLSS